MDSLSSKHFLQIFVDRGQNPLLRFSVFEASVIVDVCRWQRISFVSPGVEEAARAVLSLKAFVDAWWKPCLQRKGVKPSTRRNYDSNLELHILPVFGELRIDEVVPLHVERFIQTKVESGLSGKTVRNLLLVLQAIMSLALDNDLIDRSPIRNRHKPTASRDLARGPGIKIRRG